jgi:hypothetical protein
MPSTHPQNILSWKKDICHEKKKGEFFFTNWFAQNFLKFTYKKNTCPLNMWETYIYIFY